MEGSLCCLLYTSRNIFSSVMNSWNNFFRYFSRCANPYAQCHGNILNLQHPTQSGLWLFDCGEGPSISYCIPPLTLENWTRFLSSPSWRSSLWFTRLAVQSFYAGIIQPLTIYGPHGIREFVEPRCGLAAHGPIIRWKLSKLAWRNFR